MNRNIISTPRGSSMYQDSISAPEPLTSREREVLSLVAAGLSNRAIAEELRISPHTTKTHTRSIYAKLTVRNRVQAINRAVALGLLP
ncbi:MAG: response regulator transcription factor [Chloroflexaceae bacterium]|nr:response regulator transcription factor [Chloroflexaceae bacterium]NJL33224.1 response regulator transcription factor [Chloroflexaceae bacterium]NJO05529.1 response regulator transcription factor [Chloroflexaceae bacterium]